MRLCEFPGCEKRHYIRGLCQGHHVQRKLGKELQPLRPRRQQQKNAVCEYPGCGRPHDSNGWCSGHRHQWSHGQDLRPLRDMRRSTDERFWDLVDKDGPINPKTGTPCWLWTGSQKGRGGHGKFRNANGQSVVAHRFAWEALGHPVPAEGWFLQDGNGSGMVLDHDHPDWGCGRPSCVNPSHLSVESNSTNISRRRSRSIRLYEDAEVKAAVEAEHSPSQWRASNRGL